MTAGNSLAARGATAQSAAALKPVSAASGSGIPVVLHVAGRVDERAFAYLGSACRALDALGVTQVVLMFRDDERSQLRAALPAGVQLVQVPGQSTLRGWLALRGALQSLLAEWRFTAIHLHGFMPCLVSAFLLGRDVHRGQVFYSPHGSRAVTTWRGLGLLLTRAVMRLSGVAAPVPVATVPHEAHWLRRSTGLDTNLLEAAVDDAYFTVQRIDESLGNSGNSPLVIASSGTPIDPEAVDRFTRLAIFLASENPPIQFRWFGNLDGDSRARLKAAGVEIIAESDAMALANRLASVAVYVQVDTEDGFPIHLAAAMAAGCACVSHFSFSNADLIRHGSTGLISHSRDELLRYVGYLVENPEQRISLGRLARDEARRRFRMTEFRDAVSRLYGLPLAEELERAHVPA
ncbi:glycosyltransferase [Derxia lacustris]|uniref:glycosyltransferase n=1 Tax=Derxia lacustris TaxID=764842 RepID=UPI000A16DD47|nr:glycosyltransferase [Derxia lacustris]